MPQTTFRVVIIFIEAMYFFFKNGFTVHGLFLYPLRYPDYYIRRRIRTFDTQGEENNIELSSMLYWICSTTLWRHTETLIRSYAFCFFRAPSRHSHGERSLVPIYRDNIFIKEHLWPYSDSNWDSLYRQHGSKCASLLNFSERFFGASAKSIRYSAWQ